MEINNTTKDNTLYIFLDIDGVLNNFKTQDINNLYKFDKNNVDAFNYLLSILKNPKIIISSSWTQKFFFEDLKKIFKNNNIDSNLIIDKIEHTYSCKTIKPYKTEKEFEMAIDPNTGRNKDILNFINQHNINSFIIIDDMYLSNKNLNFYQIQTNNSIGLTKENIDSFFNNKWNIVWNIIKNASEEDLKNYLKYMEDKK